MTTKSAPKLTLQHIARYRMHSLRLDTSVFGALKDPHDVVRHHLCMQSQDWGASRWAIGSRVPGSVDADVLKAYDSGKIVRSWPMRGTVHAVEAQDIHWMLELMGVRTLSSVQRRWDYLGINEKMLEDARAVVVKLLKGGKRATRAELAGAVAAAGIDLAGQRGYHKIWYLAQTGTLVSGPIKDGEQQLVLLDEWVKKPRKPKRDDALAILARRYIASHGPVSVDDLARWSNLTKGDCKTGIEANMDDLVELELGKTKLFATRELIDSVDPAAKPAAGESVHALAAFDEHILGYKNKDAQLAPEHLNLVVPGSNGVFRNTIVRDGVAIATWTKTKRAKKIVVKIEPFTKLAAADHKRAVTALNRYGDFIGTPVEVAM